MLSVAITLVTRSPRPSTSSIRGWAQSRTGECISTPADRVVFPDGSDKEYLARMLPLLEKAVVERVADDG